MLLQFSHSSKSNATNRILKLREQFLKSAKENSEEITNTMVRSVKSFLRVEVRTIKINKKKTTGKGGNCEKIKHAQYYNVHFQRTFKGLLSLP